MAQMRAFPRHPRIVFMGTPEYAVPSLKRLIEQGYNVQAVVTQPDRPRGRGRSPLPPAVKDAAERFGLPVLQPERASDEPFRKEVAELAPDLLIVVAFGQILKKALLEIPRWGALNIHASLLPRYRGAAPIQWAVINGEEETGLTAMRMDEGLDTGPILLQERVGIGPEETAGDLHDRLARLSGEFLIRTLEALAAGHVVETPQDPALATYAPKIGRGMSRVEWHQSARAIANLIRGLDPWPGATTLASGKEIKLFLSTVESQPGSDALERGIPGTVLGVSSLGLRVETGEGVVAIRELQAPGRRRLPAPEFLRGFPIREGTVLGDGP